MKLVDESQTDDFRTDSWVLHNTQTIWEDAPPCSITLRRQFQPESLVDSEVFGDEAKGSCNANANQLRSDRTADALSRNILGSDKSPANTVSVERT